MGYEGTHLGPLIATWVYNWVARTYRLFVFFYINYHMELTLFSAFDIDWQHSLGRSFDFPILTPDVPVRDQRRRTVKNFLSLVIYSFTYCNRLGEIVWVGTDGMGMTKQTKLG